MKLAIIAMLLFFSATAEPLPSTLQTYYGQVNETYFWDSLPKDTSVKLEKNLPVMGDTWCEAPHANCSIRVDETSNPILREQEITLLHEMCHVATWGQEPDPHGLKWMECMHRLADAGAMDNLW